MKSLINKIIKDKYATNLKSTTNVQSYKNGIIVKKDNNATGYKTQ